MWNRKPENSKISNQRPILDFQDVDSEDDSDSSAEEKAAGTPPPPATNPPQLNPAEAATYVTRKHE